MKPSLLRLGRWWNWRRRSDLAANPHCKRPLQLGFTTKQGNSLLRFLLVEAQQVTARSLPEWRRQQVCSPNHPVGTEDRQGGHGPPSATSSHTELLSLHALFQVAEFIQFCQKIPYACLAVQHC